MDKNMKKVSVIGVGKLGICFALNLERKGYEVVAFDNNKEYLDLLRSKKFNSDESGVNEMLLETKIKFTESFSDILQNELIFVIVATPTGSDGIYDHSQVESVSEKLQEFGIQSMRKKLVICCTTMPGYCDKLHNTLIDFNYEVSYNPEFIAMGTIVRDQRAPDMVLIGESSVEAGESIAQVYQDMCDNTPRICRMKRIEAEITKLALNCFLTTKITYANMVGDVVSRAGGDPKIVLNAIGADSRIGSKYLNWGFGYGGPCFPRDNRSFGIFAQSIGIDALISIATDEYNNRHLGLYATNFNSDVVVFDYVTYKPQSTMLEESQELKTAVYLAQQGKKVIIRERIAVIKEVKSIYGDLFQYEER
jgi:UDPglucose 6-dehydrogenase